VRVDLDPRVRPDIVASITELKGVRSRSVDAVFSSHNLEHLYAHEVPLALREFRRVLKDDGFALVTTPDLEAVARAIVKVGLEEKLYSSPAGPIAPIDVIFGHRASTETSPFMAHRTGFSKKSLLRLLGEAFASAACGFGRSYDLWGVGLAKARGASDAEAKLKEISKKLSPARA
jgi:ubiquinone/menaquinone biosynthesis C-methylase UbiE